VDRAGWRKKAMVLLASLMSGFLFIPECCAYHGRVVDVPEGDLLLVAMDSSAQKVRLYGIACPAFGQPFHDRARFLVQNLSLQRSVEVTSVYRDADGIENVLIRIEGAKDFLNNQLIGYGLAWVRPCDQKSRLCEQWKKQEGFAQMNFIGLWAQPPAIAPWEWRSAQRKQIYERGVAASKETHK
jgi:endonuclease YncB( thermonuclease family)